MSSGPPVTSSFQFDIQSLIDGIAKATTILTDFQTKFGNINLAVGLNAQNTQQQVAQIQASVTALANAIGGIGQVVQGQMNGLNQAIQGVVNNLGNVQRAANQAAQAVAAGGAAYQRLGGFPVPGGGAGGIGGSQAQQGLSNTRAQFLAILGASRLVNGQLGQIVRGFGFMSLAAQNFRGQIVSIIGVAVALAAAFLSQELSFSKTVNQARIQAEGMGLTLQQFNALNLSLQAGGRDATVFTQGIRNINEAISGLGPNANKARAELEALIRRPITSQDTTIGILKELSVALSKLPQGQASAALSGLFGRGAITSAGELLEVVQKLDDNLEKVKEKSTLQVQLDAKDAQESIAQLDNQWETIKAKLLPGLRVTVDFVTTGLSFLGDKPLHDGLSLSDMFFNLASVGSFGLTDKLLNRDVNESDQHKENRKTQDAVKEEFEKNRENFLRTHPQGPSASDLETDRRKQETAGLLSSIDPGKLERFQAIANQEITIEQLRKQAEDAKVKAEEQKKVYDADSVAVKASEDGRKTLALYNAALQQEGALRAKLVQEEKKLTELKKDPLAEQITAIQDQVETLKESAQGLEDPEQLSAIQSKIQELLKKAIDIAGGLESGAEEKQLSLRKQANQLLQQNIRDLNRLQIQELKRTLDEIKASAQEATILAEEADKVATKEIEAKFGEGQANFAEVLTTRAKGIQDIASAKIFGIQEQLVKLRDFIEKAEAEIAAGNADPQLRRAIDDAKKQTETLTTAQTRAEQDESREQKNLTIEGKKEIINIRAQLAEIDLANLESNENRRLALLERAGKTSLAIEADASAQRSKIQQEKLEEEIGIIASKLNDEKNLFVQFTDDVDGLQVNINPVDAIKKANPEQIQEIISNIKSKGQLASPEDVKTFKEIITLLNQILDLKQKSAIEVEDQSFAKQQDRLRLLENQLVLEQEILNIREKREQRLEARGFATQAQISRTAAEFSKSQLSVTSGQADLALQRAIQFAQEEATKQVQAGKAVDVNAIFNSSDIQKLLQGFVQLKGASAELYEKFLENSSIFGIISKSLEEVSKKVAGLQGPFASLSPVFSNLSKLIEQIFIEPKVKKFSPEDQIKNAGTFFLQKVQDAATSVSNALKNRPRVEGGTLATSPLGDDLRDSVQGATAQAANEAIPGVKQAIVDGATKALTNAGDSPDTAKAISNSTNTFVQTLFSSVINAAGGVLQGIAAKTTGGRIAGFGGALGSIAGIIPGIGPAVGGIISTISGVVGGIFDFFSGLAKERAAKIANEIEQNFQVIMQSFQQGTLTLGQTLGDLNAQWNKAKQELLLSNIPGGRAAFDQINNSIGQQILQLRDQEVQIQTSFKHTLDQLTTIPEDARSLSNKFQQALQSAQQYLKSFDNPIDAINKGLPAAQEFLMATLKQDQVDLARQMTAFFQSVSAQETSFLQSRLGIINQGRVQTGFEAAQNKLQQLFALETQHAQQQAQTKLQETAFQDQQKVLNDAFVKANNVIDRMTKAFEKMVQGLGVIFQGGQLGTPTGALAAVLGTQSAPASAGVATLNANINITAGSAQEAANLIGDQMAARLATLGKVGFQTGRINTQRPYA